MGKGFLEAVLLVEPLHKRCATYQLSPLLLVAVTLLSALLFGYFFPACPWYRLYVGYVSLRSKRSDDLQRAFFPRANWSKS